MNFQEYLPDKSIYFCRIAACKGYLDRQSCSEKLGASWSLLAAARRSRAAKAPRGLHRHVTGPCFVAATRGAA